LCHHTYIPILTTVAPHSDEACKYQTDHFMHYTVCECLATKQRWI